MAILIPALSDIFSFDTPGEEFVYHTLSTLSDEFTVLYNPKVDGFPNIDFLVLCKLGILVIEVKDWSLGYIQSYSETEVILIDRTDENPVKTSQNRSFQLATKLAKYSYQLKNNKGKFIAAYSGLAWYPNMSEYDITNKLGIGPRHTSTTLFRNNHSRKIAAKDTLSTISIEILILTSFEYQNLYISQTQIALAVDLIFDKKYVKFSFMDTVLALDSAQYEKAVKLDMNQHIIIGSAGTGKTILLIARTLYLSEHYPNYKILISSNKNDNLTLIKNSLSTTKLDFTNISFISQSKIDTLLNIKFDVVLIDEMQDFSYINISKLKNLLFNPTTNHFIGFTDCAQNSLNIPEYTLSDFGNLYYLKLCYRNQTNIFNHAKNYILSTHTFKNSSKNLSYYNNTQTLNFPSGIVHESNLIISYTSPSDYINLDTFCNHFFPTHILDFSSHGVSLNDIAILIIGCSNVQQRVLNSLILQNINHKTTILNLSNEAVTLLPNATSKGAEFRKVFVLLSPNIPNVETSLLIASTRATEYLHIIKYKIQ